MFGNMISNLFPSKIVKTIVIQLLMTKCAQKLYLKDLESQFRCFETLRYKLTNSKLPTDSISPVNTKENILQCEFQMKNLGELNNKLKYPVTWSC